uniref:tetratricopeptide repeat protein 17-like isoform X2 n=1 Tax=Myxine glutinosa TaxID=7769 RepID=UPI00358EB699
MRRSWLQFAWRRGRISCDDAVMAPVLGCGVADKNLSRPFCVAMSAAVAMLAVVPVPTFGTMHWIVTEDGRIQQQVDSQLSMKHPHDLVLFMRQEARVESLKRLEQVLVDKKIHIEENEDKDTRLEERHYKDDVDCSKADVPLGELDLYDSTFIPLERKNIWPEEYIDIRHTPGADTSQPDCTKAMDLPYSMHAFQHLRGVQERANLSASIMSKEDAIFQSLPLRESRSIDQIGHLISEALKKNNTSWVLYNMASFFWRMKNQPFHVVECAMRALHLSPREHKDIALVNLGNVLHRGHFSADAVVVVHAAVDVAVDTVTSHYTLGNIYAMLGEYNHSVLFYQQALMLQPWFKAAAQRQHAVLCQQKLEHKLEAQHRSLQLTLSELKEYQRQHDLYLEQQEQLERLKISQEEQLLRSILHETHLARDTHSGNHQLCKLSERDKIMLCQSDQPVRYSKGEGLESVERVQFGQEESIAGTTKVTTTAGGVEVGGGGENGDAAGRGGGSNGHGVSNKPTCSSPKLCPNTQGWLWPGQRECLHHSTASTNGTLTFYPSLERKGLDVEQTRMKLRRLAEGVAGRFEPECSSLSAPLRMRDSYRHLLLLQERNVTSTDVDHSLQRWLADLFPSITDYHLIPRSLAVALQQHTEPVWLFQLFSGLYWVGQGRVSRGVDCLHRSLHHTPLQWLDIPLVSIASVLMHSGRPDQALEMLLLAAKTNDSEVSVYLALGSAHLTMGNLSASIAAYRKAAQLMGECSLCKREIHRTRCYQLYPSLYSNRPLVGEQQKDAALKGSPQQDEEHNSSDAESQQVGSVEQRWREGLWPECAARISQTSSTLDEVPSGSFELGAPCGTFEGSLEVKGHRVDLQGLRVVSSSHQDPPGPCFGDCNDGDDEEWITVQVKRSKKHRMPDVKVPEMEAESANRDGSSKKRPILSRPESMQHDWPTLSECQRRDVQDFTFPSTWLPVSAKDIDLSQYIDFGNELSEPAAEPTCDPTDAYNVAHLSSTYHGGHLHYNGESQLEEMLKKSLIQKYKPQPVEEFGARIAKALEKNQTSWVLNNVGALYWRVKGHGQRAMDCLRQALHLAPYPMQAVPLISLANVLLHTHVLQDAAMVAKMALDIEPHLAIGHFTMGNVYLALHDFQMAVGWYESALELEPDLEQAANQLFAVRCHILEDDISPKTPRQTGE